MDLKNIKKAKDLLIELQSLEEFKKEKGGTVDFPRRFQERVFNLIDEIINEIKNDLAKL